MLISCYDRRDKPSSIGSTYFWVDYLRKVVYIIEGNLHLYFGEGDDCAEIVVSEYPSL